MKKKPKPSDGGTIGAHRLLPPHGHFAFARRLQFAHSVPVAGREAMPPQVPLQSAQPYRQEPPWQRPLVLSTLYLSLSIGAL